MIEAIENIPDVVWAAVIASAITVSGVVLSNRNSRRQAREQLKHDSRQRDREREMQLRQDVYIRASEAITRGQNVLTRLCDLNLSDQDISADFIDDSAALAKIQVVGTNETVQAVAAFQKEVGTAYLELTLDRVSLITRMTYIEFPTKVIEQRQDEQDHLINFMK